MVSLPAPSPTCTALVTGASSGIGVELARGLVRRGHGVTLLARRADRLEDLAGELRRSGVRVEVLARDLADPAGRGGIAEELAERGLEVSVLVNNAGLSTLGPVHRGDTEAELRMVEVDVMAVVELCSRLVPPMVERGAGAVLNVASTASFQPLPGQAGYGASKAFVRSYTEALAAELRGTGVHATVLCPGPVETEFGDVAGFDADATKETLPSFMWETPQAVADVGLHALAAGRTVAIPGPANRALAMVSYLTPKRLLLPLLARQHPGLRD